MDKTVFQRHLRSPFFDFFLFDHKGGLFDHRGEQNFSFLPPRGPKYKKSKKGLRRCLWNTFLSIVSNFYKDGIQTECCETFLNFFSIFQNFHFCVNFYIGLWRIWDFQHAAKWRETQIIKFRKKTWIPFWYSFNISKVKNKGK